MSQECIVSIGMSNYCLYGGGTNLATREYQVEYNKKNISYIFISPLLIHGKRYSYTKKYWSIVIDGVHSADLSTKDILKFFKEIYSCGSKIRELHIHHFQFIEFEEFERIIGQLDCKILMFIHDYSTLCSNFTLLDDNNMYCGDGGIYKEKCKTCRHYQDSKSKIDKYTRFWNRVRDRIQFVFPSNVAQNVWLSAYSSYSNSVRVVPHQIFEGEYSGNRGFLDEKRRLKIAYIGAREYYKGWNIFNNTFHTYSKDNRFSWYYLGIDNVQEEGITSIYVDNRKKKDSMIQALRENKIDVVILWSLCKETYSYTFFESLASDVFIVTNENSGNIAAQVTKYNNGIVLLDEKQLLNFFEKDIIPAVSTYKKSEIICPKRLNTNIELIEEVKNDNNRFIEIKPKMNYIEYIFFVIESMHYFVKQKRRL